MLKRIPLYSFTEFTFHILNRRNIGAVFETVIIANNIPNTFLPAKKRALSNSVSHFASPRKKNSRTTLCDKQNIRSQIMNLLPTLAFGIRVGINVILGSYAFILILTYSLAAVPIKHMINESLHAHYKLTLNEEELLTIFGIIGAVQHIGSLGGILVLLPLVDSLGRKKTAVYIPFIICGVFGAGLQTLSQIFVSVECFVIAELFLGFGIQLYAFATIVYLCEAAPIKIRGATWLISNLATIFSATVTSTLAKPDFFGNNDNWHIIPLMALAMGAAHCLCCAAFPESPKYLVSKGRVKEAALAIKTFHGKDADLASTMNEIQEELMHRARDTISIRTLLKVSEYRKSVTLVVLFALLTPLCPATYDYQFYVIIRQNLGWSIDQILLQKSVIAFMAIPLHFVSAYFIEKFGRKPLVCVGAALTFTSTLIMALGQRLIDSNSVSFLSMASGLLSGIVSATIVHLGANSLGTLLVMEACSAKARILIAQVAAIVGSSAQMFVSFIYPILLPVLGAWTYIIMGLANMAIFYVIMRRMPETAQRSVVGIVESLDCDDETKLLLDAQDIEYSK